MENKDNNRSNFKRNETTNINIIDLMNLNESKLTFSEKRKFKISHTYLNRPTHYK